MSNEIVIQITDNPETDSVDVQVGIKGGEYLPFSPAHNIGKWVIENLAFIVEKINESKVTRPSAADTDGGGSGAGPAQERGIDPIGSGEEPGVPAASGADQGL